jgi:enoyl-CoA hydratase/carnithine racemase
MASESPPSSYTSLPYGHIKISHVPASTPSPTPVLVLTLNRPDKHNAFTSQMQREICHFYELIENDPRVRVVVLTGAGGRMFCAGADLEIGFTGGASRSGSVNSQNTKDERDVDHRDGWAGLRDSIMTRC